MRHTINFAANTSMLSSSRLTNITQSLPVWRLARLVAAVALLACALVFALYSSSSSPTDFDTSSGLYVVVTVDPEVLLEPENDTAPSATTHVDGARQCSVGALANVSRCGVARFRHHSLQYIGTLNKATSRTLVPTTADTAANVRAVLQFLQTLVQLLPSTILVDRRWLRCVKSSNSSSDPACKSVAQPGVLDLALPEAHWPCLTSLVSAYDASQQYDNVALAAARAAQVARLLRINVT